MENKAVFLDRDGTINVDKGYVYKIEDLEILPNVVEGLKLLRQAGYKLIIITNQSGIARGYYTEEDYFRFKKEMHEKLKEHEIFINAEYFCPHHPNGTIEKYKSDCDCRKPKTGMLEQAARDFNLNLRESWMIGDSLRDIQTGKNAGCRTIHILIREEKNLVKEAEFVARDMLEAAHYILNNKNK